MVPGGGPVSITNCRAEPPAIGAPPEETELKWDIQNAASVVITGIGPVQTGGGFVVRPLNTTTYTIVATGFSGDTASCNVTVPVGTSTGAPTVTIQGAPIITTDQRTVTLSATATNTGSGAVTYTWRSLFPRSGQLNSNSGQTVTATIIGPAGDTQFSVTATNAAGQSSTAYVTVRFTRPNDQIAP